MSEIVSVGNLSKIYGTNEVLKKVNLKIYPGEVLGFVGRNGAGKSTFIHIITGITHKSSGNFKVFGNANVITSDVKKKLGVMPDVSNLYDHMKGIAFLKYMGELAGDKRKKREYRKLFKEVGLEGAENKRIKSYSFGMKKKICIAQALLGNPQLIILDEPTSGVDPESAIKIRRLILKLKNEGKTILLTSHNLEEIEKVSDRVAILNDGAIKKIGAPEELKFKNDNVVEFLIRTEPQLLKDHVLKFIDKHDFPISFIKNKKEFTHLTLEKEEDIPVLTEKLISDGVSIYEIKIKEQSLEDVFMMV